MGFSLFGSGFFTYTTTPHICTCGINSLPCDLFVSNRSFYIYSGHRRIREGGTRGRERAVLSGLEDGGAGTLVPDTSRSRVLELREGGEGKVGGEVLAGGEGLMV